MKWTKTQKTANAGVLFVQAVVNEHGSIYRPVHQETDIGIDGYIELTSAEEASGRLIAVQIKSGQTYFSTKNNEFTIAVDQRHLDYWNTYMVPVILIAYNPIADLGVWISIGDYVEHEKYHSRDSNGKIRIPIYRKFDTKALDKGIAQLAHARADERILLRCADKCLGQDAQARRDGFSIIQAHPDSRELKITALFARKFLMDEDVTTAKDAIFALGYAVARKRWSWNPSNEDESEVAAYASELCRDLSEREVRYMIELIDDEHFSGPQGLGERCFDILCCCFDTAAPILEDIVSDKLQPIQRRANALYILNECDDYVLEQNFKDFQGQFIEEEVYRWMLGDADEQAS